MTFPGLFGSSRAEVEVTAKAASGSSERPSPPLHPTSSFWFKDCLFSPSPTRPSSFQISKHLPSLYLPSQSAYDCSRVYAGPQARPWLCGDGARPQVAHRLGALAALAEDLDSVPSTHIRQLTATCNSSLWEFDAVFWPLGTCTHT